MRVQADSEVGHFVAFLITAATIERCLFEHAIKHSKSAELTPAQKFSDSSLLLNIQSLISGKSWDVHVKRHRDAI
jgi:hypothetical protein